MSNSFIPQTFRPAVATEAAPVTPEPAKEPVSKEKPDRIGSLLLRATQYILVTLSFLLPIFFIPGLSATLGFGKVLLTAAACAVLVIVVSLSTLRFKQVKTVLPLPLAFFWLTVLAAFVSAFLSGDVQDALRGSFMEVHTAAFWLLLGLVMTVVLVLQRAKLMTLYTIIALTGSAALLFLYNVIRFFLGPVLDVGSFPNVTISPIGGLNDLALFAGVTVVIGLITLLQLPLKRWMSAAVAAIVTLGLLVLMVANFFNLWIIVGFFSLVFLIYILSRDTLFSEETSATATGASPLVIGLTLMVAFISILFVVAGDYAGQQVSRVSDVSYIEVRPSLSATADIMRSVYQDDILLGTGPNRFADAWRLHKDRTINETSFWAVDFAAGFGLVPTVFITFGLLGGLLLLAFHGSLLVLAYRTLLRNDVQDSFWYYVATISFAATIILWGISYVYVPGVAVLLITALFTGLSFVSYGALVHRSNKTVTLVTNRRRGLLLMGTAVVSIVLAVTMLFTVVQQYTGQATFAAGARTANSVEEFEQAVQTAYQQYPDEQFLIALNQLKIRQLQELLALPEPTEAEQAQFVSLVQQAIALGTETVLRDQTSPAGYIALADIYNVLDRAGVENAAENVQTNITEAVNRDPLNPSYELSRAFLATQVQDYETARQHIDAALALKNNYTEAFFLLAQVAVQEGNVEQAIAATERVVQFEPNNPVRYYQLGLLLAANQQFAEAIAAYEVALQLDQNYANARYMLALAVANQGDTERAIAELRQVQASNQDNQQLAALIQELESTGTIASLNLGLEAPVEEAATVENTEDGVVSSEVPETNLLSPVNTNPATTDSVNTETVSQEADQNATAGN